MTVDVRSLSKSFPASTGRRKALQDVTLSIAPGEFVAVVGPSGCGKSTLLAIIAGLIPPTAGEVAIDGAPVSGPRRDVGFMFQTPVLLPWRTVEANVLLPGEIRGLDLVGARRQARALIEAVGLGDYHDAYPKQLSGGMQQRAALARVLVSEPRILLMDEPFGALDELTREAMNLELMRLTQASAITVLFVTHNIAEAILLADRVLVMSPRPGRLSGSVAVPFARPRTIDIVRQAGFGELAFEIRTLLGHAS